MKTRKKKNRVQANKQKLLYAGSLLALPLLGMLIASRLFTQKPLPYHDSLPPSAVEGKTSAPLLAFFKSTPSQTPLAPSAAEAPAATRSYGGMQRASIRYTEGSERWVIYGTDYASIDGLFAPDCRLEDMVPMLDLRAHRLNDATYAANVGLIGRYASSPQKAIYGVNAYYDFRQGSFGNYNGLGLGLELLHERWDLRANGYIPLGDKSHFGTCSNNRFIFACYGLNLEAGYTAPLKKRGLIYMAAGPYYFSGESGYNVIGGEIRIRPQYKDILALDFLGSYDNKMGANGQVQIILSLPLYQIGTQKHRNKECLFGKRMFYKPVERFEVMQLGKRNS